MAIYSLVKFSVLVTVNVTGLVKSNVEPEVGFTVWPLGTSIVGVKELISLLVSNNNWIVSLSWSIIPLTPLIAKEVICGAWIWLTVTVYCLAVKPLLESTVYFTGFEKFLLTPEAISTEVPVGITKFGVKSVISPSWLPISIVTVLLESSIIPVLLPIEKDKILGSP